MGKILMRRCWRRVLRVWSGATQRLSPICRRSQNGSGPSHMAFLVVPMVGHSSLISSTLVIKAVSDAADVCLKSDVGIALGFRHPALKLTLPPVQGSVHEYGERALNFWDPWPTDRAAIPHFKFSVSRLTRTSSSPGRGSPVFCNPQTVVAVAQHLKNASGRFWKEALCRAARWGSQPRHGRRARTQLVELGRPRRSGFSMIIRLELGTSTPDFDHRGGDQQNANHLFERLPSACFSLGFIRP